MAINYELPRVNLIVDVDATYEYDDYGKHRIYSRSRWKPISYDLRSDLSHTFNQPDKDFAWWAQAQAAGCTTKKIDLFLERISGKHFVLVDSEKEADYVALSCFLYSWTNDHSSRHFSAGGELYVDKIVPGLKPKKPELPGELVINGHLYRLVR